MRILVATLLFASAGCTERMEVGRDGGPDAAAFDGGTGAVDATPAMDALVPVDAPSPVDAARDAPMPVDAGPDAPADSGSDAPPSDSGPIAGRIVFVTRLPAFDGNLGGLTGADAICNARAAAAGVPGTFMAWLSVSAGPSPSTRFVQSTIPYVRLDGVQVAADWTDLTDGTLAAQISIAEDGSLVDRGNVWTSTEADGTPRGVFDCTDWTTSFPSEYGIVGNCLYTTASWTALGAMPCMDRLYRLYCFEQ